MQSESTHPDSIHESVRRLMRWRYLVVAGVSVAAWVAIGSTSALAADQAQVHQSNSNTSTTVVDNNDGQSAGLISGPIVLPVTLGVQTNAAGPANVNALSDQSASGGGAGGVAQSNVNASNTLVENHGAQSAGLVSGPVVAPITLGAQTGVDGPINANAVSNQTDSGAAGAGDGSQTNMNWSTTLVDGSGAQSTGLVAGPVVAPVTLGAQTNVNGPIDANVAGNQAGSGSGPAGNLTQVNMNRSVAMLDNSGAGSAGLVSGPIVLPISPQVGTNVDGPVDANVLSNQLDSGNGPTGGDPIQTNVNDAVTMVDNSGAQSAAGLGAVAGPVVVPISPQVGTNLDGPINANVASNQVNSGDAGAGALEQGNFNSSFTMLNDQGAQSAAAGLVGVAGPVVAPISPQIGTNLDGPVDANALSGQRDSGNGFAGDPMQVNADSAFTWVDNQNAQSDAVGLIGGVAAAGPIVAPISPQVGTNVSGPVNVDAASNQAGSGNGTAGDVMQDNLNGSFTWLGNQGAQSAAAGIGVVGLGFAGPVVVPVAPQVGTDLNGPFDANVFSNQAASGDVTGPDPQQLNANGTFTFVDNGGAESDAFGLGLVGVQAAGPVVAPISPQVGTDVTDLGNANVFSNQLDSGNGAGNVFQSNFNGAFTWVNDEGALSDSAGAGIVDAAVSGPVVAPISPQVGTNLEGPVNANVASNQANSGNGGIGDPMQLNWNGSWTWVDSMNALSDANAVAVGPIAGALAASGPIVVPVSPEVGTNVDGPVNVDALSNQLDSGNAAIGEVRQLNWDGSWTWVDSMNALSDANAVAVAPLIAAAVPVSGPVVVPVSPQVGTDVNGPIGAGVAGNQVNSGNGGVGDPMQLNWNGSWTWVEDMGGQSAAGALAIAPVSLGVPATGPIVAPVSPQVGTAVDGPVNAEVASNQLLSGNAASGDVWQTNVNSSWTAVDHMNAASAANALSVVALAASGPIVAPVSPQVGTAVDGPANVNALSAQRNSGIAGWGELHQLNWNSAWMWLGDDNAVSEAGGLVVAGAVAGPVAVPVSPQVGTNLAGPINFDVFSAQVNSGNGSGLGMWQDNVNDSFAALTAAGGASDALAPVGVAGPIAAPLADDVATNLTGPANVSAGSDQLRSGNPVPAPMDMAPAALVQRLLGPSGLAGVLVAALAGLAALGSLFATRRPGTR